MRIGELAYERPFIAGLIISFRAAHFDITTEFLFSLCLNIVILQQFSMCFIIVILRK